jgi:cytidylate kinase
LSYNVAIDGPAGAGKSTVAKIIAEKLNMIYIDTGAMYRAITLQVLRENTRNEAEIIEIAKNVHIIIKNNRIFLNGEDVTNEIRNITVSQKVSEIAKIPEIRTIMAGMQKKLAEQNCIVMDGRDIGTTVLPDAKYKFFLTADLKERAKRRYEEYVQSRSNVELSKVEEEIMNRDRLDRERACSPLVVANNAIIIDTTDKTISEVAREILDHINRGENSAV